MTRKLVILHLLLCLLGMISCKREKNTKNNELSLDPKYIQIEKINSFAKCKGPDGDYTTEVISEKNGELFFSQVFEYRELPFIARLDSNNKGYTIDKDGKVSDTLSNISTAMIRSHDFHRIQTDPGSFFLQIKFEKDVDTNIELYSGVDRLNNPVKIYYNRTQEQIEIIDFLNITDTSKVIKVEYKKWIESDYGKLAKEIEIVQAKKDTFNFDFKVIEINKE